MWWDAQLRVCVGVAQVAILASVCTAGPLPFLAKDFKMGLGLDVQDLIPEGKTENQC